MAERSTQPWEQRLPRDLRRNNTTSGPSSHRGRPMPPRPATYYPPNRSSAWSVPPEHDFLNENAWSSFSQNYRDRSPTPRDDEDPRARRRPLERTPNMGISHEYLLPISPAQQRELLKAHPRASLSFGEQFSVINDPRIHAAFVGMVRILRNAVVRSPHLFTHRQWTLSPLGFTVQVIGSMDANGQHGSPYFLYPLWRKVNGDSGFKVVHCVDVDTGFLYEISTQMQIVQDHNPTIARSYQLKFKYLVKATSLPEYPSDTPVAVLNFGGEFLSPDSLRQPSWDQLMNAVLLQLSKLDHVVTVHWQGKSVWKWMKEKLKK